jgi:uncharacterized protein YecT (DUF1311 family)
VLRFHVHAYVWRTILVTLSLLGSTCLSDAQLIDEATVENCGSLNTQSDMNDCAAREAHKADDALNSTYQEVLGKLKSDKTATARMVAAEKAWIAFRDAELAADWPVADGANPNLLYGSVHPFCYYNARTVLTLERLKTLKDRMKHEEEGNVCSIAIASTQSHQTSPPTCGSATTRQNVLHVHKPLASSVPCE